MDHVAIMKKSWGLVEKILGRRKTIESRWYASKRAPWDKIKRGDTIYFKNSGEPVTIKAVVGKVLQFSSLTPDRVMQLIEKHGKADGIEENKNMFYRLFRNKKYCILVFLSKPEPVKPFWIDKSGFGAMSSWICVDDIRKIKSPACSCNGPDGI